MTRQTKCGLKENKYRHRVERQSRATQIKNTRYQSALGKILLFDKDYPIPATTMPTTIKKKALSYEDLNRNFQNHSSYSSISPDFAYKGKSGLMLLGMLMLFNVCHAKPSSPFSSRRDEFDKCYPIIGNFYFQIDRIPPFTWPEDDTNHTNFLTFHDSNELFTEQPIPLSDKQAQGFFKSSKKQALGYVKPLLDLDSIDKNGSFKKITDRVKSELYSAMDNDKPDLIVKLSSLGLLDKRLMERWFSNAIRIGAVGVVSALIKVGLSPSHFETLKFETYDPRTPLGIAAKWGNHHVAWQLLNNGASIDDVVALSDTGDPMTALEVSIRYSGSYHKPNANMIALLLMHHADVSKIDTSSLSSFVFYASYYSRNNSGIENELELLLQAELSPNSRDPDNESLLSIFIKNYRYYGDDEKENGRVAFAEKLIEYGADIAYVDDNGQTYLHKVCSPRLTQILIDKGLDVNAKDNAGRTPIEYCRDLSCRQVMIDNGASNNQETGNTFGCRV